MRTYVFAVVGLITTSNYAIAGKYPILSAFPAIWRGRPDTS